MCTFGLQYANWFGLQKFHDATVMPKIDVVLQRPTLSLSQHSMLSLFGVIWSTMKRRIKILLSVAPQVLQAICFIYKCCFFYCSATTFLMYAQTHIRCCICFKLHKLNARREERERKQKSLMCSFYVIFQHALT